VGREGPRPGVGPGDWLGTGRVAFGAGRELQRGEVLLIEPDRVERPRGHSDCQPPFASTPTVQGPRKAATALVHQPPSFQRTWVYGQFVRPTFAVSQVQTIRTGGVSGRILPAPTVAINPQVHAFPGRGVSIGAAG